MTEYCTRVVLLCRDALLVGYAIFGGVDKILRGSDDSYYREDAERYGEVSSIFIVINKIAVYGVCKRFRYVMTAAAATTAAFARVIVLTHLCVKDYRIDYLDDSNGDVLGGTAKLGCTAEIGSVGVALEYTYVAFTAIKYDLLFKNCYTLKFLRSAGSETRLEAELDIELDIYRIKSPVESNGLDADIRPRYTCVLCANVCCMGNNAFAVIGKNYLNVFEAVSVTAGIKDLVCFYANCLLVGLTLRTARKSIFSHDILFPPDVIKMSSSLFFNIVCK